MSDELPTIPARRLWQMPLAWVVAGALLCSSCCIWTVLDIPGFVAGRTDILGNYVDEVEKESAGLAAIRSATGPPTVDDVAHADRVSPSSKVSTHASSRDRSDGDAVGVGLQG